MKLLRFITYSDFKFCRNYKRASLDVFLKNIPKAYLLQFTASLGYRLLYRENSFDINNDTLITLFFKQKRLLKKYSRVINKIRKDEKIDAIIFTPIANLKIQQYAIFKGNEKKKLKITKKILRNLFKAYLYINETYNEKMNQTVEKLEDKSRINKLIFGYVTMLFPQIELVNSDVLDSYCQFFKGIFFFKYLSESSLKDFIPLFLKSKGFSTWPEYMKVVNSINMSQTNLDKYVSQDKATYIITFATDLEKEINFMANLDVRLIDLKDYKYDDDDFKILRNFPVFRLTQHTFAFLNFKLFQDKLFHSILFDFHKIYKETKKSISLPKFKQQYYSKHFIEEYLLRYLLLNCFRGKFNVNKSTAYNDFECSDYYLDSFNNLILIECKDILVSEQIKNSFDPPSIIEYINKILVEDSGVTQIVNVLKKIDSGNSREVPIDNILNKFNKVFVYPVIIYTDKALDCNGINYHLNSIFMKEIAKINFNKIEVKNLILININTFIKYFELFKKKRFNFLDYLKIYIKYLKTDDSELADFNSIFIREVDKLKKKVKVTYTPILGEFWKNNDIKIDL
ncbi:MAG: hypothetical protein JST55_03785 [Bacteroidetes bacterium]|nr:hypothetical protein [Bacteroidota bacterium]